MNQKMVKFKTDKKTVYDQTVDLFNQLKPQLNNTVRTWIYLKNMDNDYGEFVRGRVDVFNECGLTEDTHYIASTCIGRSYQDNLVELEALIIEDLPSLNPVYMSNTDYMPHTHTYGVTFERGTKIHYDDREVFYISGTASINKYGRVAYKKKPIKQIDQIFLNIEKLLEKYGSSLKDIIEYAVYYRNMKDATNITQHLFKKYPVSISRICQGEVCRPEWLVEVEAIAMRWKNDRNRPSNKREIISIQKSL